MNFSELRGNQYIVQLNRLKKLILCEVSSYQELTDWLCGSNFKAVLTRGSESDFTIRNSHGDELSYKVNESQAFYAYIIQRLGVTDKISSAVTSNRKLLIPHASTDKDAYKAYRTFMKQDGISAVRKDIDNYKKSMDQVLKYRDLPENLVIDMDEWSSSFPGVSNELRVLRVNTFIKKTYIIFYIDSKHMVDLISGEIYYLQPYRIGPFLEDGSSYAYIGSYKHKMDLVFYRELMSTLPSVYQEQWESFKTLLQKWIDGN